MLKKVLMWGGLAFLVFFVSQRPKAAANVVGWIGGGIWDIATGFGDFVAGIFS